MMDDSQRFYETRYDKAEPSLALKPLDGDAACVLTYARPDAGRVLLQGVLEGQLVLIMLRQVDTSQFPTANASFHWISGI